MLKVTIIDGYVDEPTCLGVPPYMSPYPRYIAGSIWNFDKSANISYFTIDQIRNNKSLLDIFEKYNIIIVIAGMAVPGRYLSGYPASPNELVSILKDLTKPLKILTGPAAKYGFGISGGKKTRFVEYLFDIIADGDGEIIISEILKNKFAIDKINPSECRDNSGAIRDYAIIGSNIVRQHPNYPDYLITEIETYRGCPRSLVGGCSFCSEPSKGHPDFRPINDIIDEIRELYKNGIRHFRLGNQPCIFSYMAEDADIEEFPKPNPNALERLFKGIRIGALNLKTLHIDNANPGVIARYPKESKSIAKTIIKYHTSGDVAALGVESADPMVIKENNLKASPEEVLSSIKLLNEIGAKRGDNGLPELLPGLNFVFGLKGETKNTFNHNYDFLKQIFDSNLMIRRINLRQVIPLPGTEMFNLGLKNIKKNKSEFSSFKRKFRKNIEQPFLKRIVPQGIVLKNVFTEIYKGKTTFGRQIGTYPLLVGIPGILPLNIFLSVKIVDYGYRSVTAIPYPININKASPVTLVAIPGIGKKRVNRLLLNRPFKNKKDIIQSLDDPEIGKKILNYINLL